MGEDKNMKHLIVDANNLLYRGHFVSQLMDTKGERVSGIFNSIRMINGLVRKFKPDTVAIVWDGGKSRGRLAVYPEYKSQRDKNRKEQDKIDLERQRKMLIKLFSYLPVRQIQVEGVEADDVIGWLCEKLKGKKIIVSNDTDFIQLVKDKVKLYMPNKSKFLSEGTVDKFLGFPVKHYILWKSMVGDNSDNIKGIHGIGPKKATSIILNGVGGKKKLNISNEEQTILDRNKYLIAIGAILQDDELETIKKLWKEAKEKAKELHYGRIKKIFHNLGFKSLTYNFDEFEIRFHKLARKAKNGKTKKEKISKEKQGKARKEKNKEKEKLEKRKARLIKI